MKFGIPSLLKITVSLMIGFSAFYAQAEKIISLDQAIALAQQNDPWLHGSKLKQQAVEYNSIASGTLPDPIMSVGMMNLPTDTKITFDLKRSTNNCTVFVMMERSKKA